MSQVGEAVEEGAGTVISCSYGPGKAGRSARYTHNRHVILSINCDEGAGDTVSLSGTGLALTDCAVAGADLISAWPRGGRGADDVPGPGLAPQPQCTEVEWHR